MTNPQSITGLAPVNAPLVIPSGEDFEIQAVYNDGSGDPIDVTDPQMQIRDQPSILGSVVLTPGLSASANTVTITCAAADTAAVSTVSAFYDLFATRTDTGAVVKLAFGDVTFPPNITTPTA